MLTHDFQPGLASGFFFVPKALGNGWVDSVSDGTASVQDVSAFVGAGPGRYPFLSDPWFQRFWVPGQKPFEFPEPDVVHDALHLRAAWYRTAHLGRVCHKVRQFSLLSRVDVHYVRDPGEHIEDRCDDKL